MESLEALDAFFPATTEASAIAAESRNAFVNARKAERISNTFINRSLELLTRLFNLAIEERALLTAPTTKKLKEPPPRRGFVTTVLFYTGVRLGEAKQIRWGQVSLQAA